MVVSTGAVSDLRVIRSVTANVVGQDLNKVVEALACAVEFKDSPTASHLYRSAMLASACLEQIDYELSLDEATSHGFLLHDIGKIGVPDSILCKAGELTDEEWEIMRSHPEMGVQIVEPIGFGRATVDVILHHHERWDGRGYPYKLEGEEIPLAARVFAVADTYDALTIDRPYRAALSKKEALRYIALEAGSAYDPTVVAAFIGMVA
jgi:putative nucleotidyltransferase with HDIG domain